MSEDMITKREPKESDELELFPEDSDELEVFPKKPDELETQPEEPEVQPEEPEIEPEESEIEPEEPEIEPEESEIEPEEPEIQPEEPEIQPEEPEIQPEEPEIQPEEPEIQPEEPEIEPEETEIEPEEPKIEPEEPKIEPEEPKIEPEEPDLVVRKPKPQPEAENQTRKPRRKPRKAKEKIDWVTECHSVLHDLVYTVAAVMLLFVFVIRLVGVQQSSMTPTLLDGEYVALLSNFLCGEYQNGDVVVASVKSFEDGKPIVKRVIATAGQTIDFDFEAGAVFVDGVKLDEPYINELTYKDFGDGLTYPLTVPENCLFLMGDNRNHSTDSRYALIGCVDSDDILGKVILRVFPPKRIGLVK